MRQPHGEGRSGVGSAGLRMAHERTRQAGAASTVPSTRLQLSPAALGIATACLVAADWGSQVAGDSLFPGGPLDEVAHFFTTLLVLWALGGKACERFLLPALVASVAIDVDHIPARLGADWLTAGTPRPYTHSLLTIAVVLVLSLLARHRRDLLLGITIGLVIHFWRDMGESGSGVALLWPLSSRAFEFRHEIYVAAMGAIVLIDAARCQRFAGSCGQARRRLARR